MTLENFKKAMQKANLLILKQTEANLKVHQDADRLAVVQEEIKLRESKSNPVNPTPTKVKSKDKESK